LNDAINEFDKVNGRKESLLPDERPAKGVLLTPTSYNNREKDCLIILDKKKRREAYV